MELPADLSESLSSIDEALSALKAGRLVIVVDAEEREDEGDFVCAAESVTPEMVSFMLRHGAGVLCVPILQETADRLGLSPIVDTHRNTAPNQTHFLTPVDHRDAGSGVSTVNRAKTIVAMSDPVAKASDFVRPGHLNPLLANEGGVLRRAGHTEAPVDLLRMAGVQVDIEIYHGVVHGFVNMGRVIPEASRAHADAGLALKQAFSESP